METENSVCQSMTQKEGNISSIPWNYDNWCQDSFYFYFKCKLFLYMNFSYIIVKCGRSNNRRLRRILAPLKIILEMLTNLSLWWFHAHLFCSIWNHVSVMPYFSVGSMTQEPEFPSISMCLCGACKFLILLPLPTPVYLVCSVS